MKYVPSCFWIEAWLEHLPAPRYRVNSQLCSHSCVQQVTAIRREKEPGSAAFCFAFMHQHWNRMWEAWGRAHTKWANQPYTAWGTCWWQETGTEALWDSFSGEQLHKAFLSLMSLWTEWPFYKRNKLLHLIIHILKCYHLDFFLLTRKMYFFWQFGHWQWCASGLWPSYVHRIWDKLLNGRINVKPITKWAQIKCKLYTCN